MVTKTISNGDNFKVLGTVKNPKVVEEIKDIFTLSKQERLNKMAREIREELGMPEPSKSAVVPMRVIK